MFKYRQLLITAITLAGTCVPLAAQQAGGTKVGVLTCNTSASLGLLVGSHQKLKCSFKPDNGGTPENYVGHVNRLGLDIGGQGGRRDGLGRIRANQRISSRCAGGQICWRQRKCFAWCRGWSQCAYRWIASLNRAATSLGRRERWRQSGIRHCWSLATIGAIGRCR